MDEVARAETEPAPAAPPRMPRWVIVLLIVLVVLALGLIISQLAGIQHGPELH